MPAGNVQGFAGDPPGILRGEEDHGRGDVLEAVRFCPVAQRFDLLAEVAFRHAGRVYSFGLDHAGIDALTRILRGPSSPASDLVMALTAALVPL